MPDPGRCPKCHYPTPWGIILRHRWDGVLFWECAACAHMWPRYRVGRLHQLGLQAISDWTSGC